MMNLTYLFIRFSQILGSPDDLGIPDNQLDVSSLDRILGLVYFIAGAVAVIMIIIGGMNYVLSSGDTGKLTKAKNTILYSVIGLVIVLGAFAITNIVLGG